nr:hypothetical protein [Actinacidiphila oryziradicis]
MAAVLVDVGGLHPVGVGAGQQGLGRGAGQRLVPLQDQDVAGVQLIGDQAGGLLGGVQRVQGQHHAGHLQRGQQLADGGAFAALVGDLPLAQHHAGLVADRPDQEDPALLGACAAQGLTVHGRRGQPAKRRRMLGRVLGGAPLLALHRARSARDLRERSRPRTTSTA